MQIRPQDVAAPQARTRDIEARPAELAMLMLLMLLSRRLRFFMSQLARRPPGVRNEAEEVVSVCAGESRRQCRLFHPSEHHTPPAHLKYFEAPPWLPPWRAPASFLPSAVYRRLRTSPTEPGTAILLPPPRRDAVSAAAA